MIKRLILIIGLLFSLVAAKPLQADPYCSLQDLGAGNILVNAYNLPTDEPLTITTSLYPIGGGTIYPTGTFSLILYATPPVTVYIWERGGGKSLIKPGPGLNDYHVIAYCSI